MLWGVQNIVHENDCLKGKNWKFIFPWRKLNWHVLRIAKKAHFRYTIFFSWFMISEKSVTRCTSLHHRGTSMHQKTMAYQKRYISKFPVLSALKRLLCGLVAFIGNEHVHNYRRQEFHQNVLERIIQLFWTVVTYLPKKTGHAIVHNTDSAYGVCIQ